MKTNEFIKAFAVLLLYAVVVICFIVNTLMGIAMIYQIQNENRMNGLHENSTPVIKIDGAEFWKEWMANKEHQRRIGVPIGSTAEGE